jgi:hypothetical protein
VSVPAIPLPGVVFPCAWLGLEGCAILVGGKRMKDDFLNQILIGVGIVTCISFGLAALLYWVVS